MIVSNGYIFNPISNSKSELVKLVVIEKCMCSKITVNSIFRVFCF